MPVKLSLLTQRKPIRALNLKNNLLALQEQLEHCTLNLILSFAAGRHQSSGLVGCRGQNPVEDLQQTDCVRGGPGESQF